MTNTLSKEIRIDILPVCCPSCGGDQVIKRGKTAHGKQRYYCLRTDCLIQTFILDYRYNCCLPTIKQHIIGDTYSRHATNGRGVSEWGISPYSVIREIKKSVLH